MRDTVMHPTRYSVSAVYPTRVQIQWIQWIQTLVPRHTHACRTRAGARADVESWSAELSDDDNDDDDDETLGD